MRSANRVIVIGSCVSAGLLLAIVLFVVRSPVTTTKHDLKAGEDTRVESKDSSAAATSDSAVQQTMSTEAAPAESATDLADGFEAATTDAINQASSTDQVRTDEESAAVRTPLLTLLDKGVVLKSVGSGQDQQAVIVEPADVVDDDLSLLAAIRNLVAVEIDHPAISDDGVAHLKDVATLRLLTLRGEQINGSCLAALATQTPLEVLDISGTSVGERKIISLAASSSLKQLVVSESSLTTVGRSALTVALPDLKIEFMSNPAEVLMATGAAPDSAASPSKPEPEREAVTVRPADPRVPVPDASDQEVVRTRLRSAFARQFGSATTKSRRRALAQTLFEAASNYDSRSIQHYVHIDEAIKTSLRAGDWQRALEMTDELSHRFEIDAPVVRAAAIGEAVRYLSGTDAEALSEAARQQSDLAFAQGDYSSALSLATSASEAARRSRDRDLIRATQQHVEVVHAAHTAWRSSRNARTVLKHSPNDPQARFVLGRFLCLYRNDWERGLSELAVGANEDWKRAAVCELREPRTGREQLDLARQWLKLVEGESRSARRTGQEHALVWLQQAVKLLSGSERTEAESLIGEVESALEGKEDDQSGNSTAKPTGKSESTKKSTKTKRPDPGEIITTAIVGGPGGDPFKFIAPADSMLVGLRVGDTNPVKFIQPIYLEEGKLNYGPILGEETGRTVDLIAKKGYRLAGVVLNTGDYVKGLSVTFAEQRPANPLRPRWYDSQPVGSMLDGKVTRIGTPEVRIIGIHGRTRFLIDGIGLVGHKR